jgi:hypothetical protein
VTHHLSPCIRQHDTHEELLGPADLPPAPRSSPALDAIIVPASRTAAHLDQAVTLAQAARCRLVVVCSRQARADDVSQLLASRSLNEAVVIDLPPGYGHRWLEFATSHPQKIGQLPGPCAARDSDLSIKRNLGLILARMLGWDRVFFMDDDITSVGVDDLRHTVSMLGAQYDSVGMRVTDFPDNSVVCHAHRTTGKFQDVWVSGSVLAVDCTAPIAFFPDVYNEDWLFFYDDAAEHRLGSSGLEATQLRYDPFDDPLRAARQEFGDVLAEGLYALLHRGQNTKHATLDYWINFLDARRGFLDAIIARADNAQAEVRQKMLDSVRAARECSAEIQPEFCEHYVQLWRKDLSRWEQTLKEIPQVPSIAKALSELGLASAAGLARGDDDNGRAAANATPEVSDDLPTPPGPVLISNAATLNDLSEGIADLALLDALANTDQMERLQTILPAAESTAAELTAAGPASQGRKRAAVGKMVGVVGVLVMVPVLFAVNGVRLALCAGSAAQQARHGRHRRARALADGGSVPRQRFLRRVPLASPLLPPHQRRVETPQFASERRVPRSTEQAPGEAPQPGLTG